MRNLIEVDRVSKSFQVPSARRETVRDHLFNLFRPRTFQKLQVLDQVSLTLVQGANLGVMGRNGSGKSTLLKILCGIYQPDQGAVTVRAPLTPILELGAGWNPELDAIDNILLIGTVMGLRLDEARAAVDEILAFADLAPFAKLELKHYSSGMAARLAYSVAFKAVRGILVLDEVFAVGDVGFRARCEERFRELNGEGHTMVLVSHSPDQVARFCEHAILIEGGKVALQGSGAEVAAAYSQMLLEAG